MELCISKGTICKIPPEYSSKAGPKVLYCLGMPWNTVEIAINLRHREPNLHFGSAIVLFNTLRNSMSSTIKQIILRMSQNFYEDCKKTH